MSEAESRWDLTSAEGAQAELWVANIRDALVKDAIEVKRDAIAHKSGNIFIECESFIRKTGKYEHSGLRTTKAELWIHVIPVSYLNEDFQFALIFDRRLLFALISAWKRDGNDLVDNSRPPNPTRGYIPKLKWIIDQLTK